MNKLILISGCSGGGKSTLLSIIGLLDTATSGEYEISDVAVTSLTPSQMAKVRNKEIGFIFQDFNLIGDMTVWENAVLERLRTPEFSRRGFVRQGAARAYTNDLIKRFDIRGAAPDTRIRLLSGGNMQKLILGRVLSNGPRFVLANQPTRGLDEGAIAAVHAELLAARAEGAAILLISEELEEAVALSDRIQAIVKGRLSDPISADEADPQRLGLMMAGVWTEDENAA